MNDQSSQQFRRAFRFPICLGLFYKDISCLLYVTSVKCLQALMRFGLRDLDTGMFYGNGGNWTANPWLAEEFSDEREVEKVAADNKVKNAEIVFLSEYPRIVGGVPIRVSS